MLSALSHRTHCTLQVFGRLCIKALHPLECQLRLQAYLKVYMSVSEGAASTADEESVASVGHTHHRRVADDLICSTCGTVIHVEGGDDVVVAETETKSTTQPPVKKRKKSPPRVKLSPQMLCHRDVCHATRIRMLAAIPGVTKEMATSIITEYETFTEIIKAGADGMAVECDISSDIAQAVLWALK